MQKAHCACSASRLKFAQPTTGWLRMRDPALKMHMAQIALPDGWFTSQRPFFVCQTDAMCDTSITHQVPVGVLWTDGCRRDPV